MIDRRRTGRSGKRCICGRTRVRSIFRGTGNVGNGRDVGHGAVQSAVRATAVGPGLDDEVGLLVEDSSAVHQSEIDPGLRRQVQSYGGRCTLEPGKEEWTVGRARSDADGNSEWR